jgi:membrane protein required for beta-lactamase induction
MSLREFKRAAGAVSSRRNSDVLSRLHWYIVQVLMLVLALLGAIKAELFSQF